MNTFSKYGCVLVFILFPFIVWGQWDTGQFSVSFSLPEVALVDVEPGVDNSIHFTILPGAESGNSLTVGSSSNNSLWLNYTSALPANQHSRKITAEVSQGTVPSGLKLFLEASRFSGNGAGKRGQPAGRVELSNQPRPVVTGIGNCYTGNGVRAGHQLTFSVEVADYSEIESAGEYNFVILYTLTDN
ncbi:hypothetical protein SAMN05444274_106108 [Mariniphaga anaerophila]|uniref:Uncharacterized protein n=1 Tax=Mariniphaga anaerophila TaxID=1484053 RepID=A0A1M5CG41_9BACT|nr:hypothetical protein [Mariniphaga anaerophila]SHF53660.1 hypothetical protein SAMN05444274_106108 [Mariniphaga anaerophila]